MGLFACSAEKGRSPCNPVNIASAGFKANPFPFYARLRAEAQAYRMTLPTKETAWLITRYDDVAMVLKDERFVKDATNALTPRQVANQRWFRSGVRPRASLLSRGLSRPSGGADRDQHAASAHPGNAADWGAGRTALAAWSAAARPGIAAGGNRQSRRQSQWTGRFEGRNQHLPGLTRRRIRRTVLPPRRPCSDPDRQFRMARNRFKRERAECDPTGHCHAHRIQGGAFILI
jgi:hypothetical protein